MTRLRHAVLGLLVLLAWALSPASVLASPGRDRSYVNPELRLPPRAAPEVKAARDLDELRDQVRRLVARHNPAGMSLALIEGGRVVWSAGFGLADREAELPTTTQTMYRVGSLSKMVVSLAVLALVEDGRLELDDPVREHLPELEFENDYASTSPVTIEQLLEHTSGFDEMRFNEMHAADDQADLPLEEVLELNPRSRRVRWRPGTRHGYSQPGYTVAARIVERASGQPFEDFVQQRVFDPLGMQDASFRYTREVVRRAARGYEAGRSGPVVHRRLHHRPGGGLYVSAEEMGLLVEMLLGNGSVGDRQVFAAETIERMERGETLPYDGVLPDYGLGNYRYEIRGVRSQGHGGWMPGFDSGIRYFPELDAGYVLLSNVTGDPQSYWPIEQALLEYLLADVEEAEPPVYEPSREELRRYEGTYVLANPNVAFLAVFQRLETVRLELSDGQLWGRDGSGEYPLLPTGPGTFRAPGDPGSTVKFTKIDGREVLVAYLGVFERCSAVEGWLRGPGVRLARLLAMVALLSPIFWLSLLLFRGYRHVRGIRLWAYPSLSAWSLTLMVHLLFSTPIPNLAHAGPRTVLVFLFSWGFGLFAALGLLHALRRLRKPRHPRPTRILRVYSLLACLALTGFAAHFASHGFIGLRTWLW